MFARARRLSRAQPTRPPIDLDASPPQVTANLSTRSDSPALPSPAFSADLPRPASADSAATSQRKSRIGLSPPVLPPIPRVASTKEPASDLPVLNIQDDGSDNISLDSARKSVLRAQRSFEHFSRPRSAVSGFETPDTLREHATASPIASHVIADVVTAPSTPIGPPAQDTFEVRLAADRPWDSSAGLSSPASIGTRKSTAFPFNVTAENVLDIDFDTMSMEASVFPSFKPQEALPILPDPPVIDRRFIDSRDRPYAQPKPRSPQVSQSQSPFTQHYALPSSRAAAASNLQKARTMGSISSTSAISTIGVPFESTSSTPPLPQHVTTRPKTGGTVSKVAGVDVPTHHSSSKQAAPSVKSERRRTRLLNPMALLNRRKSSNEPTGADDEKKAQELANQRQKTVASVGVQKLPDDYDPRIKGKIVHDFSAPRRSTMSPIDHSYHHSPFAPSHNPFNRPQARSPAFVEHLPNPTQRIHKFGSGGIGAENRENKDFLVRFSQQSSVSTFSQESAILPPFARRSQNIDAAQAGHWRDDDGSWSSDRDSEGVSNPAPTSRESGLSSFSIVSPMTGRSSSNQSPLPFAFDSNMLALSPVSPNVERKSDPLDRPISTVSGSSNPEEKLKSRAQDENTVESTAEGTAQPVSVIEAPLQPTENPIDLSTREDSPLTPGSRNHATFDIIPGDARRTLPSQTRGGAEAHPNTYKPRSNSSSRFSFQSAVEGLAEEKALEQKAEIPDVPQPYREDIDDDEDFEYFDEDAINDLDELEMRNDSPLFGAEVDLPDEMQNTSSVLSSMAQSDIRPVTSPAQSVAQSIQPIAGADSQDVHPVDSLQDAQKIQPATSPPMSLSELHDIQPASPRSEVHRALPTSPRSEPGEIRPTTPSSESHDTLPTTPQSRSHDMMPVSPPSATHTDYHVSPLRITHTNSVDPQIVPRDDLPVETSALRDDFTQAQHSVSSKLQKDDADATETGSSIVEERPSSVRMSSQPNNELAHSSNHMDNTQTTHVEDASPKHVTASDTKPEKSAADKRKSAARKSRLADDEFFYDGPIPYIPNEKELTYAEHPVFQTYSGLVDESRRASYQSTLLDSYLASSPTPSSPRRQDDGLERRGSTSSVASGLRHSHERRSSGSSIAVSTRMPSTQATSASVMSPLHERDESADPQTPIANDAAFQAFRFSDSPGTASDHDNSLTRSDSTVQPPKWSRTASLWKQFGSPEQMTSPRSYTPTSPRESQKDVRVKKPTSIAPAGNSVVANERASPRLSRAGMSDRSSTRSPMLAVPHVHSSLGSDSNRTSKMSFYSAKTASSLVQATVAPQTTIDDSQIGVAKTDDEPESNGRLQDYHQALADAANKAAEEGRFTRQASVATVDTALLSPTFKDAHSDSVAAKPSSSEPHRSLHYDDQQFSSAQQTAGAVEEPVSPNKMAFDFGFDEPSLEDDSWNDDHDDFDIVAAANADALANDHDGFYGSEFGFYAKAKPGVDHTVQAIDGGYFGEDGDDGLTRQRSVKEPNLTPITERSEFSTRNSFVGLGGFGTPTATTPILARMPVNALSSGDIVSFEQLKKLRQNAFGGSSASLSSSQARGSPTSPHFASSIGASSESVGSADSRHHSAIMEDLNHNAAIVQQSLSTHKSSPLISH